MTDLANDVFSNNIEYVAKQLQTFVDHLFPANEDNSKTLLTYNPYIVTGQCSANLMTRTINHVAYAPHAVFNLRFDSNNGSNMLSFMEFLPDYDVPAGYESDYLSQAEKFHLIINPLYLGDRVIAQYNPTKPYSLDKSGLVQFLYTNENYQTAKVNGETYFIVGASTDSFSYYGMRFNPVYLRSSENYKPIIITNDYDAADEYNRMSTLNDYTYSTTINYSDGSVYVGGKAGGLALGLSGNLSYSDIENAFDILLTNMNNNLTDGNKYPVIDFPSYDEIKYADMGDFYIEPLHQYDLVPAAPTFDGTIDLGDYPKVLSEGANTFLNFMPATLSALFTAAFVACVVIKKLGR